MGRTVEIIMKISGLLGVVFGVFFWVQAEYVSAADFSRHLTASEQTVILLQLSNKRTELYRQKQLKEPDTIRIEEIESHIRILEEHLVNIKGAENEK